MSEPRIRRFSKFAILFHWMVGLPYMALLASGGLIMLQRTGILRWQGAGWVETLHKWLGIGLVFVIVQGAFAAILTGRVRAIRKDLADWILIRPRDLHWLIIVPFNIFWPRRFKLPAVGRYNAGQKLHGLFIVMAMIVFAVTGILMICRPADLRSWIVHSWVFYGAAAFLAIHLFLGLINRATRPALGGIFTGYVPKDYLQDHHPLVLDEPAQSREHAVVSWRAMAATWAVAFFAAAGVLRWYGPDRITEKVLLVQGQEHAGISPGPLFAAHADDPRIISCQTCHQSLEQPPNEACLTCHTEVRTVMDRKLGIHGQFEGLCRDCHADHRGRDADLLAFDSRQFNHDRTRFALAGKHRILECAQCHVAHSDHPGNRQFIGLTQSCADCHIDPHQAQLANDCIRCHSSEGWTGRQLVFDHNRDASFKIDAIHSALSCAACHSTQGQVAQFRLGTQTCETCHAPVALAMAGQFDGKPTAADPHNARLRCIDCHSTDAHAPTATQFAAKCVECHTPRYRGLFLDWERSLDDHAAAAREAVLILESKNPEKARPLYQSIITARKTGIHNTQAIVQQLRQITETAEDYNAR